MNKKLLQDAIRLFPKILLGSAVCIMLLNFRLSGFTFKYFYQIFLTSLATAILWVGSGIISEVFSESISWLKMPVKRLFFSLVVTLIFTFSVWWFIASAWAAPEHGFDPMLPFRNFNLSGFLPTLLITLFISIFMHGRGFLIEWRQKALEAEQLKKEQIEARYETLKNQVNPHFLFNSLNVLTALVHKDADMAEQFIRQLSAVYRYVLDSRDREVVPLEEEINQLEAFIYLMKIRFGHSFNAIIDIEDQHGEVAPLTLQMLVENCIKHNELSKNNPLTINITRQNGYILVTNNLHPRSTVAESSGVGLENIRSRYQFLSSHPMIVLKTDHTFEVKIPVIQLAGE